MSSLKTAAENIERRIVSAGQAVAFTGLELVPIFVPLLTGIINNCFRQHDDPEPSSVFPRIVAMEKKNPNRTKKRLAAQYRKGQKLNRQQSFIAAEHTLDEIRDSDGQLVSACFAEVAQSPAIIDGVMEE